MWRRVVSSREVGQGMHSLESVFDWHSCLLPLDNSRHKAGTYMSPKGCPRPRYIKNNKSGTHVDNFRTHDPPYRSILTFLVSPSSWALTYSTG